MGKKKISANPLIEGIYSCFNGVFVLQAEVTNVTLDRSPSMSIGFKQSIDIGIPLLRPARFSPRRRRCRWPTEAGSFLAPQTFKKRRPEYSTCTKDAEGKRLLPSDFVISADEKTGLQAL